MKQHCAALVAPSQIWELSLQVCNLEHAGQSSSFRRSGNKQGYPDAKQAWQPFEVQSGPSVAPVGALVGLVVGAFVGLVVGAFVGLVVGALVGLVVGAFVGLVVGAFVGLVVGACVGLVVGACVGLVVGACEQLDTKCPVY